MGNRDLCLELAYCDSEDGVIEILKRNGLWEKEENWVHYGSEENNYATIGNQQSRPESALVEKIINSVDAVLMSECIQRGINPESAKAPMSIKDALKDFFSIRDGKLTNLQPQERTKLSENICVIATGTARNPSYSIIDKGEGQTPEKMCDTLLSIGKSNKLRIPFVKGKYNMGGTGVFRFCGIHNLQLVISKRHPKISAFENEKMKDKWSFTVVRREDPKAGVKSSTYKYLAPSGQVLSFEGNGLPLLPGDYPKPYEKQLRWGTFIKLYEYQMTGGLKTNIVFDLYNKLSILLPSIALPIRLYERRKGYSGHSLETTLSGLTVRLDEDRRDNLEEGFPISVPFSVMGNKMMASIYVFKKGESKKYSSDEGIIFTINGQTHGHLPKYFFKNRCKMGYLDDSLLIIVDCSDIEGRAREDLFMNSRDRLCSGKFRSEIEMILEEIIKNNPGLKELNSRRRLEEIENKIGDSKPLVDIIEDILKKSPTLSKMFIEGIRISNPFKIEAGKTSEEFQGKKYPTYFALTRSYPEESPKDAHINMRFKVQYKTDADNDYFSRDIDPGEFILKVSGERVTDYTLNLWNGYANLTVKIPDDSKIGDVLHLENNVSDVSRAIPITDEFFIKICEAISIEEGKKGERKKPSSNEKGNEVEKTSSLDIPNIVEVRKDEWEKYSFTERSALKVIDGGENGYDYYVNMDNVYLLTELKGKPNTDPEMLNATYMYGMALIGLAIMHGYGELNRGEDNGEESVFDKIEFFSEVISPFLLPMISSLGSLDMDEKK